MQLCVNRQNELRHRLEEKLSSGLEQCLSLAVTRIHVILSNEQKKADFRDDASFLLNSAGANDLPASSAVCCNFLALNG